MTPITEMSDQEKSEVLCKLADIKAVAYMNPEYPGSVFNSPVNESDTLLYRNLYHPAKMSLAWLVLNWGMDTFPRSYPGIYSDSEPPLKKWGETMSYWVTRYGVDAARLPAEDAQRLWLDKILELAIDGGMIAD